MNAAVQRVQAVEVSALVFPELRVEIEAGARLDLDLRTVEKR